MGNAHIFSAMKNDDGSISLLGYQNVTNRNLKISPPFFFSTKSAREVGQLLCPKRDTLCTGGDITGREGNSENASPWPWEASTWALVGLHRDSPAPRPGRSRACLRQVSPPRCSQLPGRPPLSGWSWHWENSTGRTEEGRECGHCLRSQSRPARASHSPIAQLTGRPVCCRAGELSEHLTLVSVRDSGGPQKQDTVGGFDTAQNCLDQCVPWGPYFVGCIVSVTALHLCSCLIKTGSQVDPVCTNKTLLINTGAELDLDWDSLSKILVMWLWTWLMTYFLSPTYL